jgi:hypothetical protein
VDDGREGRGRGTGGKENICVNLSTIILPVIELESIPGL